MTERDRQTTGQDAPVFRFAPSPNGRLHLGHALSAFLNAEMAGKTGGRLLLRIEDIDLTRCTPDFEQAVIDDLTWLGISCASSSQSGSGPGDVFVRADGGTMAGVVADRDALGFVARRSTPGEA